MVERLVKVLDAVIVRGDADAGHTALDEAGGYFGLVAANVRLAEEELTIEVGDVDCVCRRQVSVSKSKIEEDFVRTCPYR